MREAIPSLSERTACSLLRVPRSSMRPETEEVRVSAVVHELLAERIRTAGRQLCSSLHCVTTPLDRRLGILVATSRRKKSAIVGRLTVRARDTTKESGRISRGTTLLSDGPQAYPIADDARAPARVGTLYKYIRSAIVLTHTAAADGPHHNNDHCQDHGACVPFSAKYSPEQIPQPL